MPGSRIELRLDELSRAELLKIATAGCEASTEVKNVADDILAAHKPLPQWAVNGVLLGTFDKDGTVQVKQALPLLHSHLALAPMMDAGAQLA